MMRVGVECGQRWWRPSSWRRTALDDNVFRFRRLTGRGFAFGPLMVFEK